MRRQPLGVILAISKVQRALHLQVRQPRIESPHNRRRGPLIQRLEDTPRRRPIDRLLPLRAQVARKLRGDGARVHGHRKDVRPRPLQSPVQLHRVEEVGGLALPVAYEPGIPLVVAPQEPRGRVGGRLLGVRDVVRLLLDGVVAEADGREAVAVAREVDDSRGAPRRVPPSCDDLGEQEGGEQEGADVVYEELEVYRRPAGRRDGAACVQCQARVVDEDVDAFGLRADLRSGVLDRLDRRKV